MMKTSSSSSCNQIYYLSVLAARGAERLQLPFSRLKRQIQHLDCPEKGSGRVISSEPSEQP